MTPQKQDIVLVADDHPVFRMGLCNLLATALPGAQLVEANSKDDVIEKIARYGPPSLLVLDFVFPGLDPQTTLGELRQLAPRTSIIVISMLDNDKTIEQIIDQGADAFVSKSIPAEEMLAAILAVLRGEFVVRRAALGQTGGSFRILPTAPEYSARQREILDLLCQGKTNKEIARALDLSPFTVRNHLSRIMQSVGVSNRTELLTMHSTQSEPQMQS